MKKKNTIDSNINNFRCHRCNGNIYASHVFYFGGKPLCYDCHRWMILSDKDKIELHEERIKWLEDDVKKILDAIEELKSL